MSALRPSPPSDITVPQPGSTTMRAVLSMSLRKLFEDLKRLRAPQRASAAARSDYRILREVLAGFLPGKPGAIASLLRRPVVSAPLRCLRDGRGDPDALIAELVGQSLFELALTGALDAPVTMRAPPPMLLAPHRDQVVEPGEGELTFAPREVRLGGVPVAPAQGHTWPVGTEAVLTTVDNNPLRMVEAHPDKEGNPIDLGGRSPQEWVEAVSRALFLIGEHLPDFGRELDLVLRQLVPVGYDEEAHRSASYREAIGTVYLTLHPNPLTMAEALIHEVSHNKLNALIELDPLLHDGLVAAFDSPVRPDKRPLLGVLLAVHAFLPIERFYERLLDAESSVAPRAQLERRLTEVRAKNREGAAVLLAHARPTEVGRGVLDEIARLVHVP